jgi:hypothetical protein
VIRRYSNRPDLLEQLRKVAVILSDDGQGVGTGAMDQPCGERGSLAAAA